MPKIQIITPDGDETRYALDIDSVKIGRNGTNDIVVDEDSMSGQHAVLNLRAGGNYELTDSGSTNGTRVNGERISEPVLLKDGDELRFGSVDALYMSEVVAGPVEELPPEQAYEPEIAEVSEPPHTFGSMSPFGAKSTKRDTLAVVAVSLAIFAMVLSAVAALMASQMTAGG